MILLEVRTFRYLHPRWSAAIAIVAFYFLSFRIHYCVRDGCTHPADWWFHAPAADQAAWITAIGTLTAVWWGFALFWLGRREKLAQQRAGAQALAYELISDLQRAQAYFKKLGFQHLASKRILHQWVKGGRLLPFDATQLKSTSIAPDFAGKFRSDEVERLLTLLEQIEHFNDVASRLALTSGGDPDLEKDLHFWGELAFSQSEALASILGGWYRPRKTIEAAETSKDAGS